MLNEIKNVLSVDRYVELTDDNVAVSHDPPLLYDSIRRGRKGINQSRKLLATIDFRHYC